MTTCLGSLTIVTPTWKARLARVVHEPKHCIFDVPIQPVIAPHGIVSAAGLAATAVRRQLDLGVRPTTHDEGLSHFCLAILISFCLALLIALFLQHCLQC